MANYKGILGKKGEIPPYGSKIPPHIYGYEDYARERENALFNFFGVPREVGLNGEHIPNWRDLALSLAEAHVPAYSRTQGRPNKNIVENIRWFDYYLAFKERDKCSDKDAYEKIANRGDVNLNAGQIKERLKSFKRSHLELYENRERGFRSSRAGPHPESCIYYILKKSNPIECEGVEVERYEQEFTRFPYGPPTLPPF